MNYSQGSQVMEVMKGVQCEDTYTTIRSSRNFAESSLFYGLSIS